MNWKTVTTDDLIWAREENPDPYGVTREVMIDRVAQTLAVRVTANERTPHFLAEAAAPIDEVIGVLRTAGYEVTKKPEGDEAPEAP